MYVLEEIMRNGLTATDMLPIYVQVKNRIDAFPPEELKKAIKKVQCHEIERNGKLRQTLVIPSIDALTGDPLVLSHPAKQQLKSTAHMQVLYESKEATIKELELDVLSYYSFFETLLTKWSLAPPKTNK